MKKLLNRLPLPISGLMLALAATGNLLAPYGLHYKNLFGLLAALIWALLLLKVIMDYGSVKEDLGNPVIASVAPTFSMGSMILATYIQASLPTFAFALWLAGLILHILLILSFTRKFVLNFDIQKVFPSYFVVYVGIVVGTVTSPAFGALRLGQALFWLGLTCYLILLPIVLYRVFYICSIPKPALPTVAIFSAPASLCLAGYMNTFPEKNLTLVWVLSVMALASLLGVLLYMPRMLRLPFHPSYSAFTFPLVINAIALKKTVSYLLSLNQVYAPLGLIADLSELLATTMVLYVLIRFLHNLYLKQKEVGSAPLEEETA